MWCMNCDRIRAELSAMTNMWKQAEDGNIELLKSIGAHKAEIARLNGMTHELTDLYHAALREANEAQRKLAVANSLLDESNRLVDGITKACVFPIDFPQRIS